MNRSLLRAVVTLAIACCAVGASCPSASAQEKKPQTVASTLNSTWTYLENSFISLADAMPAEKYSFAPSQGEFKGVRTFGEQVKHVACANFGFFKEIEGQTPPPACSKGGPDPAKTKAELMKYLRSSFDYADGVMATIDQQNALAPVSGPYGGRSTKLGIAVLAVWHAADHYGQLVEYLRMNGIVPPASRPVPPPPAAR